MDVGVRDLKQHLSEYLDRVQRGQSITITDRGRPKAMLVPIAEGDVLADGIEQGWITPAASSRRLRPVVRATSPRRVADVIDEDRGD